MPAEAGTQNTKRRRWLTAYAPLIIWTVFTLGLGSGAASMSETSRFVRPLLEWLFPAADADTLYLYHAAIRKLAHVFQYGVLGILAARVFFSTRYVKASVLYAVLFVALVGSVDEINQSFDPARTSTVWDVVLDIAGGIVGAGTYPLLFRRRSGPKENII